MTPEELSKARKDLLQQIDAILHDAGFPSPPGTLGEDLPGRLRRVVARAQFSELAERMGAPLESLLAGSPGPVKHFMDDSKCEDCDAGTMRRQPDTIERYELEGEVAEWPAPVWECRHCGAGQKGEHDNDDAFLARERMFERVIAKLRRQLGRSEGPVVDLLLQIPAFDITRGPTGEKIEELAVYPEGSEQAELAERVLNACAYLSELPVLIRKKDYSEILHHAGHIGTEAEELRYIIRRMGDREKGK